MLMAPVLPYLSDSPDQLDRTVHGVRFALETEGTRHEVRLGVPGRHNASNALAAITASRALGVRVEDAVGAIARFDGLRRRLEIVGEAGGVTVIDDFAHNPDKIAATLNTLHDFPGRLLVMFQPHGFGPLAKMKSEFIDVFASHLRADDMLVMPEPVYFGGTVERSVTSADIAEGIRAKGRTARQLVATAPSHLRPKSCQDGRASGVPRRAVFQ